MEPSGLSQSLPWLLQWETFVLLIGGFVIGIFSVVVGGGFFFSMPLFQWLFPRASYGVLVGNLKVGSFFRGIGSTWENRKEIDFVPNIIWSIPLLIGTVLGVMAIAHLDQRWILLAMIAAVLLAEYAPKIVHRITPRYFYGASVLAGAYSGFLGAGIGIMLVALVRLKRPEDEKIAQVEIQARFIEWFIGIIAVIVHFLHGNLILTLWLVWSVGSFVGGIVGGKLLRTLGTMPGRAQKMILRGVYVVALITAVMPFLR